MIDSGIDSYTRVMFHCNVNPSSSTTFLDSSFDPFTTISYGDVYQDTSQHKFGDASARFDGTENYISTTPQLIGTVEFCADMWIRISTTGTVKILFTIGGSGGASFATFAVNTTTSNYLQITDGGSNLRTGTHALSGSKWYHIAVVGNGGTAGNRGYRVYLNGVLEISVTRDYNLSGPIRFGGDVGTTANAMSGWMDELRFSLGTQRWTTDFTPPYEEYTT